MHLNVIPYLLWLIVKITALIHQKTHFSDIGDCISTGDERTEKAEYMLYPNTITSETHRRFIYIICHFFQRNSLQSLQKISRGFPWIHNYLLPFSRLLRFYNNLVGFLPKLRQGSFKKRCLDVLNQYQGVRSKTYSGVFRKSFGQNGS